MNLNQLTTYERDVVRRMLGLAAHDTKITPEQIGITPADGYAARRALHKLFGPPCSPPVTGRYVVTISMEVFATSAVEARESAQHYIGTLRLNSTSVVDVSPSLSVEKIPG